MPASTPAKITPKVAVTNNAAKDDYFAGALWMNEDESLSGVLNVLANDPGSAKIIGVSQGLPAATAQLVNGGATFAPTGFTGTMTVTIVNGALQVDASGLAADLQALGEGQSREIAFYYTAQMANGAYSSARVSFTVTGANDDPTIGAASVLSGTIHDTPADDAFAAVTGAVVGEDVDSNDSGLLTYALADGEDGASDYGSFTLDPDGSWSFTPDDSAVEGLKTTMVETFDVTVSDGHGGSVTTTVSVTLAGVNDVAEIAGVATGAVAEDGVGTAGGTLTVADRDDGDDGFQTPASLAGAYGLFTFDPVTGAWTYALDNSAAQSLGASSLVSDSLIVTSADGTDSETITVSISGANDDPTVGGASVLAGTLDDSAGDDSFATLSGAVVGSDVDVDDAGLLTYALAAGEDGLSEYGAFTLNPDGSWSFAADDAAVEGLKSTVVETFDLLVADGHGGSVATAVAVTLNGVNDTAEIGGDRTGAVAEDGAVQTASGILTVTDRDDTGFAAPASLAGTYGTFTFDTGTGAWTYTLANGSAAVQGLNIGQIVFDTLTVSSADGTDSETISIQVTGAYDPPPAFTGTGDSNDNDNQAVGATVVVSGNQGNNPSYKGTAGNDVINATGNPGNNMIWTGAGNDIVNANNGNDTVFGGSGDDVLNGNSNQDVLYGGSGADTVNGNDGNDTIVGGYGADALSGGAGNDIFVYLSKLDTGDVISDLGGGDKIDLTAFGDLSFQGHLTSAGDVAAGGFGWFARPGGGITIFVDTDGIAGADLEIHVANVASVAAGDFSFL